MDSRRQILQELAGIVFGLLPLHLYNNRGDGM